MVCAFGASWINQALNAVSDEEHVRRRVMRGNELVRNSTCALVRGGQCHRDAGLLGKEKGPSPSMATWDDEPRWA